MPSHRISSLPQLVARQLADENGEGERLIPMRLDIELAGEVVLSVGGVWDRLDSPTLGDNGKGAYVGEADSRSVAMIHPGQLTGAVWFRSWIAAHAIRRANPPREVDVENFVMDMDPAHVYSALFAGGRRGGKTWLATALAIAYSVAFPGAIVWVVSPSDQKHDEVRRYVEALVPMEWRDRSTVEGWELRNGSTILLKSGWDPEGLKEGEVDFALLNEGQMIKQRAYTIARGGVVDRAGLVLVCANPPVEAKDQQWVSDFAADAAAGKRASVYVEFNPLDNPHIDRGALLSMQFELDERSFAIEVLGQFRGPKDAVAYNWIRLQNELPAGDPRPYGPLDDVTERFLAEHGEGDGIEQIIGLDVQRVPYIGGPVIRLYAPSREVPTIDNVIAWIVGEVVLDGGDEVDWCQLVQEGGYGRETTLIVCDASGRYQHSRRRKADDPPPEWKGRGSFSLIRGEGYMRIVPPSRRQKKNPEIIDRVRAFTSRISTKAGRRRLFADPDKAPRTCQAIREWKTINGKASRSQNVAHLGDAASYPIVRLFPRVLRSGKPGEVDPLVQVVDFPEHEQERELRAARQAEITLPAVGRRDTPRGTRGRGL